MMRADAYQNRMSILTACRDLISQHGTTEVTVKEITTRAAVSPATFYRHFTTKDAVIDEVSISRWKLLEHNARNVPQDAVDPLHSLKHITRILDLYSRTIHADMGFIEATGVRVGHAPYGIVPIRESFEPYFAQLWTHAQRYGVLRAATHPRDALEMTAGIRNSARRMAMFATLINGFCSRHVDAEDFVSGLFRTTETALVLREF